MKKLSVVETIKKGRSTYGAIFVWPDGKLIYCAYRGRHEYWRDHKKTVTDAMHNGAPGWALDDETLTIMRAKGIWFVGVLVVDDLQLFITTLDQFYEPYAVRKDYTDIGVKGGADQRYLPIEHFRSMRVGRLTI